MTTTNDYLTSLPDWSIGTASAAAKSVGIDLGPEHMVILEVARQFFNDYGFSPSMRPLCKNLTVSLGVDKGRSLVFKFRCDMIILSQQEISATPKGADKLSPEQVAQLMPQLPEWTIITIDTIEQLYRAYSLKDFNAAISFSNKIAAIADNADHHPTLSVQWGTLAVYWWSHSINGIHINDLVMAAKTDEIYKAL
jgi:4a-hydroxytetrahydrobiopterin dehydratase